MLEIVAPVQVSLIDATSIHAPVKPAILSEKERPRFASEVPENQRIPGDLKQDNENLRVCFICYVGSMALRRSAPINVTPPINRGNSMVSEESHRSKFLTLADPLHSMWSTTAARRNFFLIESLQHHHNMMVEGQVPVSDPNFDS